MVTFLVFMELHQREMLLDFMYLNHIITLTLRNKISSLLIGKTYLYFFIVS